MDPKELFARMNQYDENNARKFEDITPTVPTKTESALGGLTQGATLGFGDELAGTLSALLRPTGITNAGGTLDQIGYESPTLDLDTIKEQYNKTRDAERDRFAGQKAENPLTFGASELAGGFATPAFGAAKAVGAGTNALKSAAAAGAIGNAASTIGTADELENIKARDVGIDALLGGAIGAGAYGVGKALSPVLVSKLKDMSVAAEGKIAGLPESSALRELMSSPSMQKLREPIKAERNIRLGKQAELDKAARKTNLDKFYEDATYKAPEVTSADRLKSIKEVDGQVEYEMFKNKIRAQEEALDAAKKKLQTDGPSLESLENTIPSLKEPTSIAPDYNVPAGYNQRNLPVGYGQTNLPIGYQNNIPAESQLMNEIVDLPVGYGNLKKFMLNK